jgi:hypothetical protein
MMFHLLSATLIQVLLQEHLFAHHADLSVLSIFADASVSAAKDPRTVHVINNTVASKYLLLSCNSYTSKFFEHLPSCVPQTFSTMFTEACLWDHNLIKLIF